MKKIIILLFTLILSGCTAEYDMSFYDNVYKENIKVSFLDNEMCDDTLCKDYYNSFYTNNLSTNYNDDEEEIVEGVNLDKYTFYNKQLIANGLIYSYDFKDSNSYSKSRVVNYLFDYFIVNDHYVKGNNIKNIFQTFANLDQVIISFNTDKLIKNSNCDEDRNGTLYWYINKSNYLNKEISIDFDVEKNNESILVEDGFLTWSGIKYIIGILVIVILIFVVVIYEKVKKSNQ